SARGGIGNLFGSLKIRFSGIQLKTVGIKTKDGVHVKRNDGHQIGIKRIDIKVKRLKFAIAEIYLTIEIVVDWAVVSRTVHRTRSLNLQGTGKILSIHLVDGQSHITIDSLLIFIDFIGPFGVVDKLPKLIFQRFKNLKIRLPRLRGIDVNSTIHFLRLKGNGDKSNN